MAGWKYQGKSHRMTRNGLEMWGVGDTVVLVDGDLVLHSLDEDHVLSQGGAESVEHTTEDELTSLSQSISVVRLLVQVIAHIFHVCQVESLSILHEHALVDGERLPKARAHRGKFGHDGHGVAVPWGVVHHLPEHGDH